MRTLRSIKFPVYPIPNQGKIVTENRLVKYVTKYNTEFIVDDLSIDNPRFLIRRIIIKDSGGKLLPLKRSILTLGNFILYSKLYKQFIDSNGKIFKYKKVKYVPISLEKITKVVPYKSGSLLIIDNVHCPLMFYRPVYPDESYAVIVHINKGYLLLGLSKRNYLRKLKVKI